MKKIISALLALCIVGGSIPAAGKYAPDSIVIAKAADIVESGKCGENITYTIDSEGLLTLSGKGATYEYGNTAPYESPFCENQKIKKVIIESGITRINSCTFQAGYFSSVIIPDTVTIIDSFAFEFCENLTSVNIPDSVTTIEGSAFSGCKSLKSVTIPNSVVNLGSAFEWCESLTAINIPDSVECIHNYTFWHCESLTSVTVPASVKEIGEEAFGDCKSLKSITILNPDCSIDTGKDTICNYIDPDYQSRSIYNGVIRGYRGSTAEAYANKHNYAFEAIGEASSKPGDINGDGVISSVDASKVLIKFAELSSGAASGYVDKYDVDGNKVVNAVDASLLLAYCAELAITPTLTLEAFLKANKK